MATGFRPYVSRLAAEWNANAPGERARVLDASLLGLDISGFTALSERLADTRQARRRGADHADQQVLLGADRDRRRATAATCSSSAATRCSSSSTASGHEERAASRRARDAGVHRGVGAAGESSVGPVQLAMCGGLVSGDCHFFLVGRHHRELIVCGPPRRRRSSSRTRPRRARSSSRPARRRRSSGLVAAERDGAFLLRRDAGDAELPLLPDEPAGADDLADRSCRRRCARRSRPSAIEAEHRQVTVAFVKFAGTDELVAAARRGGGRRSSALGRRRLGRDATSSASRGSSRTSTATAASSTSSPARPRAPATTRSGCCARCARSSTRASGRRSRVGVNRGHVFAGADRRAHRGGRTP